MLVDSHRVLPQFAGARPVGTAASVALRVPVFPLVREVSRRVVVWPDDLFRPDVQAIIGGLSRNERRVLGVVFLARFGGAL